MLTRPRLGTLGRPGIPGLFGILGDLGADRLPSPGRAGPWPVGGALSDPARVKSCGPRFGPRGVGAPIRDESTDEARAIDSKAESVLRREAWWVGGGGRAGGSGRGGGPSLCGGKQTSLFKLLMY